MLKLKNLKYLIATFSLLSLSLTSSGNDDWMLSMSIQATELERGPVIPLIIIQRKRVEKAYCSHI